MEVNNSYDYDAVGDPFINISKKAENAQINLCWIKLNASGTGYIKNDGKNTKIFEWYVTRSWVPEVRGKEYWGT